MKVIENVTIQERSYDFLLMFYSNYHWTMALSHVVSEIYNADR